MKSNLKSPVIDPFGPADDWQNLCLGLGVGSGALAGGLIGFAIGPWAAITGAAIGAVTGAATGFVISLRVLPGSRKHDADDELGPPELDLLPDSRDFE